MLVQLVANRLSLTAKLDKKRKTLQKVDEPDQIKIIEVDQTALLPGNHQEIGFKIRQVFDIDIQRLVTEYRAQVLEDQFGKPYTAPFPAAVTKAVQYDNGVKHWLGICHNNN